MHDQEIKFGPPEPWNYPKYEPTISALQRGQADGKKTMTAEDVSKITGRQRFDERIALNNLHEVKLVKGIWKNHKMHYTLISIDTVYEHFKVGKNMDKRE